MDVQAKMKESLIQSIGAERYDLWFERNVRFSVSDQGVDVTVVGEFAIQRLRANFFRHIQSAAAATMGRMVNVCLVLAVDATTVTAKLATAGVDAATPERVANSSPELPASPKRPPRPSIRVIHDPSGPIDAAPLRMETRDRVSPSASACPSTFADGGRAQPPVRAQASVRVQSPRQAAPSIPIQGDAMTFANFASGPSNLLAHTAAQLLGAEPSDPTPICFWGATGTGKTHLLHAIRHELRTRHRMQRVILLSAEDFTNDFLVAVRGGGLPAFRRRYRDVDALLVDNIQFFGGKSATLREVLYTVDTIVSRRRPLVLAGDRPPTEIEGLSDELAGRMASGLVCGLNPLAIEVRRELLRRESNRSFMVWDDATIDELAKRVSGDGRLIQGLGRLVSMLQRMYRRMPTMAEILREAGDLLQRGPRVVALSDIEKAVCSAFNLPVGELRGEAKSRNVSQPRILAMYLARMHTNAAFSEIGRYFGNRNHSTVIAANRRAETWIRGNECVGGRGPQALKAKEAIDAVENLLRIG